MTIPFTPETLATRWGVSATTVRNMCGSGELSHFRLGKLYRIPVAVVEEVEHCERSVSEGSEADIAFSGPRAEHVDVISLRHAPERRQKAKGATGS